MQPVTTSEPKTFKPEIQFNEPVSSLLRLKRPAVWSVSPGSTVYQAIEQMAEREIGALVVLEAGRLEGIVTERDYARKVILKGKHSQAISVCEIMTRPVLTIGPEQSIDECLRLMSNRHVRHLPVLEEERVVGMVSMGDLVNWIILSHEQTIQQLQSYIAGDYPG
jgi:CBS domain-containing protein